MNALKNIKVYLAVTLSIMMLVSPQNILAAEKKEQTITNSADFTVDMAPAYSGDSYAVINDNTPFFSEKMISNATKSYESYGKLDSLKRCGVCVANIGNDLMPTEERGSIGSVKPSGWHTVKYNDIIEGNYLYNRCHLIGYQLTGENANKKNLITGTRWLNVGSMLQYENMVASYINANEDCHVLYRVTPVFEGDNLVASGVLMEGYSVEDQGASIKFNVYCYNVQPGIDIDYATGDSAPSGEDISKIKVKDAVNAGTFGAVKSTASKSSSSTSKKTATSNSSSSAKNTSHSTKTASPANVVPDGSGVWITASGTKYHLNSSCSNMKSPSNVTIEEAEQKGYTACKKCAGGTGTTSSTPKVTATPTPTKKPTATPAPTAAPVVEAPAPVVQEQVAAPAPAQNEAMVWISGSGKKYHSNASCSNMKNPSQVSKSDAIASGRDACKKCY